MVTDGPFGEVKEVIGGYWFIVAAALRKLLRLPRLPVSRLRFVYEIRPIDRERATAFTVTTETPREHRDQL